MIADTEMWFIVDEGTKIIDRERRVWKKAVQHALKQVCVLMRFSETSFY